MHGADGREVMLEVARTLRPDGIAVVEVPNYGASNRRVRGRNWCGFRLPGHVNSLIPRSLATLAALAGLRARLPLRHRLPTDGNLLAILQPA